MEENLLKMQELIESTKSEINVLEDAINKAEKIVVLYKNNNENLFYGLISTEANQICKGDGYIHNIMPSPHPSMLKLFDTLYDIHTDTSVRPLIKNGNNVEFVRTEMSYLDYLHKYLSEIQNTYNEFELLTR